MFPRACFKKRPSPSPRMPCGPNRPIRNLEANSIIFIGNGDAIDPRLEHARRLKRHDPPLRDRNCDPVFGIAPNRSGLSRTTNRPNEDNLTDSPSIKAAGQLIQHRLHQHGRFLARKTDASVHSFRKIDTREGSRRCPRTAPSAPCSAEQYQFCSGMVRILSSLNPGNMIPSANRNNEMTALVSNNSKEPLAHGARPNPTAFKSKESSSSARHAALC